MSGKAASVTLVRVLAFNVVLATSSLPLAGAELTITQTNWVERWITNVINIQMPDNRFVNEYHTNWVIRMQTNIVEVPVTNWTMVKQTKEVQVAGTWTNSVTAYHTNWVTRTLTNHMTVNLVRTNFVQAYQTNYTTLALTNWETVVLFKTNWITEAVTNVVQVDRATRPVTVAAAPSGAVEPQAIPAEASSPVPAGWGGPLAIEAARTSRVPAKDLVEVHLKLRRTDSAPGLVQVQNWRVEREDGAVLLFGQEQEFKRALPVGRYKVEAKVKAEGDRTTRSVRGTLSVTLRETTIQPRLLVKK